MEWSVFLWESETSPNIQHPALFHKGNLGDADGICLHPITKIPTPSTTNCERVRRLHCQNGVNHQNQNLSLFLVPVCTDGECNCRPHISDETRSYICRNKGSTQRSKLGVKEEMSVLLHNTSARTRTTHVLMFWWVVVRSTPPTRTPPSRIQCRLAWHLDGLHTIKNIVPYE